MAIDHPSDALPPGFRLGPYEILRVLGRGGFGVTYQARRAGVAGDMVAIKELFPTDLACRQPDFSLTTMPGRDDGRISDTISMFLREARLICGLDHPNIVRGTDAFAANGTGYLVMRYVSGRSLRDCLRDPGGFKPSATSIPALLAPLLDGLATLHGHELLHCDIKPDNIFLGVGFEPILIDLGSARWNAQGGAEDAATYSHYFSAIEQVSEHHGPIGPWTDIYQLSAVLYRCLSGGKLPDARDRAQAATDPYLPLAEIPAVVAAYPPRLVLAIDAGLQLHPRSRPNSVAQWRQLLADVLPRVPAHKPASPQQSQTPPTPTPPVDPPAQIEPTETLLRPAVQAPHSGPDCLLLLAGGLVVAIIAIVLVILAQG